MILSYDDDEMNYISYVDYHTYSNQYSTRNVNKIGNENERNAYWNRLSKLNNMSYTRTQKINHIYEKELDIICRSLYLTNVQKKNIWYLFQKCSKRDDFLQYKSHLYFAYSVLNYVAKKIDVINLLRDLHHRINMTVMHHFLAERKLKFKYLSTNERIHQLVMKYSLYDQEQYIHYILKKYNIVHINAIYSIFYLILKNTTFITKAEFCRREKIYTTAISKYSKKHNKIFRGELR